LYLPRLRALYVEGLTVEELRYFLSEKFKAYVKSPQLYMRPVGYRAVQVYVGGEITRPGSYLLSAPQKLADELSIREGTTARHPPPDHLAARLCCSAGAAAAQRPRRHHRLADC